MLTRVRAALERPRVVWLAAALGFVLSLPSLGNGLLVDDYFQRRVAQHGRGYFSDVPLHQLDLFGFFPSVEGLRERGLETGLWPWWVSDLKVHFFRPISALTHFADYRLWPEAAWLMHLHSALWYACLVAAVAALFRRVLGKGWPAGLAAMIYAVDDGHAGAVGWLATRNMIIATTFGVLCVLFHHRARAEGWKPGRWLSPLALSMALLSAEFGIGTLGYVGAYALLYESGTLRARLLSVAPHLAVLVAWQATYSALGFGAGGTGLYVHPLHAPADFLIACAERAPVLLLSQLTFPVAEIWLFAPVAWGLWMGALSVGLLVLICWPLRKLIGESRALRFFGAGAILAVVPNCSTYANERMLFFVGLGTAAIIAMLVQRLASTTITRIEHGLAYAFIVVHVVVAAPAFAVRAATVATLGKLFDRADASLPSDADLSTQSLVVVNAPHAFLTSFPPILRQIEGRSGPRAVRTLGATLQAVEVTRTDAHTIEIATAEGYGDARLYQIFREPSALRPKGYRVDLGEVHVEVIEATPDGRHRKVRFRFAEPLEAARWRWVSWVGDGFAPFVPPPVGTTTTLPAIDMLDAMRKL